jgi:hypothetical protein
MMERGAFCPDRERDLVKTGSLVVHECDVTNWASVFRVLVALMFSAVVRSAARTQLNG